MNPSPDSSPVLPDEFVFRRIPSAYFNPHNPIPIKPEAFRPTGRDTNGISVFRERFVTPDQILATVEQSKRSSVLIVKLSVSEIAKLQLTVVPDPFPEIPGHALIPELNAVDYAARKIHWKEIQYHLSVLASRDLLREGHQMS